MTYFLLANPNSGNRRGGAKILKLLQYLERQAIDFKLFETSQAGQEASLLHDILKKVEPEDLIVIIGGDGTLSLCLDVLPATRTFAYIPTGSGNDFARALGISLDPITAFQAILAHQAQEFFVLAYQSASLSGYAVNNIGIGLDGAIIEAANKSKSKTFFNQLRLGQLSYLYSALAVLFQKKSFQITSNVQNYDQAWLFTLTKHPYFGGGIQISPEASNLNNQIELIEVDQLARSQFFGLLLKVIKARHLSDPRVHHTKSQKFDLQLTSRQPMQIDGEAFEISAASRLRVWTEKRTIIK